MNTEDLNTKDFITLFFSVLIEARPANAISPSQRCGPGVGVGSAGVESEGGCGREVGLQRQPTLGAPEPVGEGEKGLQGSLRSTQFFRCPVCLFL